MAYIYTYIRSLLTYLQNGMDVIHTNDKNKPWIPLSVQQMRKFNKLHCGDQDNKVDKAY